MQREGGVAAAEDSNEVVLVGRDGMLRSVGAVHVRRNELESDSGVLHDLFEAVWALVVKHLKVRLKPTVGEVSVDGGVCTNYFVLTARFEGICNDGITVIVVENHEVFAAANGSDGETTCLVCGDLAGDFDGHQECHFGLDAGLRGGNDRRCHCWRIVVYGRGGGNLGGPNILSFLAKMSLGGCQRLGKMFADELRGEAKPSGVIAGIDGRSPC